MISKKLDGVFSRIEEVGKLHVYIRSITNYVKLFKQDLEPLRRVSAPNYTFYINF